MTRTRISSSEAGWHRSSFKGRGAPGLRIVTRVSPSGRRRVSEHTSAAIHFEFEAKRRELQLRLPGHSGDASRRALASPRSCHPNRTCPLLDAPQAFPLPVRDESGPHDTSRVQDTHKTSDREVHYRWHPWYGQQVHVQVEARRRGGVILHFVQGEVNRSPALEIPEWMFDSGLCSGMKEDSQAHVSAAALLALHVLLSPATDPIESSLVQAQHLSSNSGGADVDNVTVQGQTGRAVFSPGTAPPGVSGSLSADGSLAGADDKRASAKGFSRQRGSGGGR
jgi:hypothetical protein